MAPIRRRRTQNGSGRNEQPLVPRFEPLKMLALRDHPDPDHVPEDYSDVVNRETDVFEPAVYRDLERRLPPELLAATREYKLWFMRVILTKHLPAPEKQIMVQIMRRRYIQNICSLYQPLHPELYKMNPPAFFLPSFLRAILGNTAESFADIIHEVAPSVYAFPMLRPAFCEMLMAEVENFLKWAHITKQTIMAPNTFHKPGSGVGISDIGMQGMLDELMKQFISPLSTVLFPKVGGGSLDSQHSFVVSYRGYDDGLGMHMEDGHVILNVCLGKQFTGGEMYFQGRRCENHKSSGTHEEEKFRYSHVIGQALLYHGRHRHSVFPSTGFRANMTMWCKSSLFKEATESKIDFPDWCIECQRKNNMSRQNIPIP